MARTERPGLLAKQKRELWSRWKAGQSLSDIGRGFGKHTGSRRDINVVMVAPECMPPFGRKVTDAVAGALNA